MTTLLFIVVRARLREYKFSGGSVLTLLKYKTLELYLSVKTA